tara:strand:+ start:691 stop:1020 length:330 start_codon:yes stop_codon:yes gene_type:complete
VDRRLSRELENELRLAAQEERRSEIERKREDGAKLREAREARERQHVHAAEEQAAERARLKWVKRSSTLLVQLLDKINLYDDDEEAEGIALLLCKPAVSADVTTFGNSW